MFNEKLTKNHIYFCPYGEPIDLLRETNKNKTSGWQKHTKISYTEILRKH
jgi:hypothetical protein